MFLNVYFINGRTTGVLPPNFIHLFACFGEPAAFFEFVLDKYEKNQSKLFSKSSSPPLIKKIPFCFEAFFIKDFINFTGIFNKRGVVRKCFGKMYP